MAARSLLEDGRQMRRAAELIVLGARLQMLQSETSLPYERLLKLYKEVAGRSPSKGQLPFSTDWFIGWQPNIHASLFMNLYEYLNRVSALEGIDAITKAWRLYAAEVAAHGVAPLLSITRAWRLVRFVDARMLGMMRCTRCAGRFVGHAYEPAGAYVCGLCQPPARAGKGRRAGAIH